MCAVIALTLCTWLYTYDLQVKFKDGCYRPIFGRVMPLEISHFNGFYSFPDLFLQCLQLLHWNFVHGFISMTYRSSSKMDAIDQSLKELCPLNLAILRDFAVFRTFFRNVYSYCIETFFVALYPWLTHQVRRWFLSTNCLEELRPLNFTIFNDFTVYMLFSDFFPQCVQLLRLNFVHAFTSIRFKIKLEDNQINSRKIVPWHFNYLTWGSVENLNRANVSTCVSSFW
jgi:hypothetical protein